MTRPPVLVLDGHTTQALACVRALGRAGYPTYVASVRRHPLAGASRYCHGRYRLPGQTLGALGGLRQWAAARGVRAVLPMTERSCVLTSHEAERWRTAGMAVGCGPADMLNQAFDKVRTLEHARACGVPVPPTRVPTSANEAEQAAHDLRLPCVVKPRFSNAWDGARFLPDAGVAYVASHEEVGDVVRARRQRDCWPMLQPYLRGRGIGVFALCDRGRPLRWFAHERLRDVRPSGSGSSLRRSVPLDPRLREQAVRLMATLRWHGPIMLEFLDDGCNPPWLVEANGRFWGSLQLAVSAGVNFPVAWVRLLLDEPVPPADPWRTGVVVRWLWGDVKRLLHILRGPPRGYPDRYPTLWRGLREVMGRQPPGTRVETWAADDRWPAVTEWLQGAGELFARADGTGGISPPRPQPRTREFSPGAGRPTAQPRA